MLICQLSQVTSLISPAVVCKSKICGCSIPFLELLRHKVMQQRTADPGVAPWTVKLQCCACGGGMQALCTMDWKGSESGSGRAASSHHAEGFVAQVHITMYR